MHARWMKRDLLKIIAEILQVTKNGAKKTHIMYQCNLSYRQTNKLLNFSLETGRLRIGNSYHTTKKGLRFLQTYQTLKLLLNKKSARVAMAMEHRCSIHKLDNE